jgi:copper(I)-binding protein
MVLFQRGTESMKIFWKMVVGLLAVSMASLAVAGSHSQAIMVQGPWVQEAPPTAKVNAGYMVLENHSGQAQVLTGASSPAFERVELHSTEISGGMARMVRQESIEIPAHGSFEFKPGGYHFMLINAKHAPQAGGKVQLMLTFADGSQSHVTAEVRKSMGGMDHSEHQMDHSSHEAPAPKKAMDQMQHNH